MLTKRQLMVFKAIVSLFTKTDQPVGSKTLMSSLPIKVSSATIRNDMVSLEKKNLIEKTHSSSGRIPTVKGYRYYLDYLIKPIASKHDVETIKSSFNVDYHNFDEIVEQSAEILSNMTSCVSIVLEPNISKSKLINVQIVKLSDQQLMIIIMTDLGNISDEAMRVQNDLNNINIEKIINLISDQIIGLSLIEIMSKFQSDDFNENLNALFGNSHIYKSFVRTFFNIINKLIHQHYYVGGKTNLLNYANHKDLHRLQLLYNLIDYDYGLTNLLLADQNNDLKDKGHVDNGLNIKVHLGPEMTEDLLNDYSLITTPYIIGKKVRGTIAILGPTQMPYSHIIGLLKVCRNELTKCLNDYYIDLS